MRIYLASPLFSEAERRFNLELSQVLEGIGPVFLPQRDGALLPELIASGMAFDEAAKTVYRCDLQAIQDCDVVVCVLDGRGVEEGVAFELGYAHALGKKCVGYHTDFRAFGLGANHPLISAALKATARDADGLLRILSS